MDSSTRKNPKHTNALAKEISPYLLQHAHNPVNWYPWSEEAFKKARNEEKPIFLSVGYSACHWCHVMEHESFENEDVARLLNDSFVSIKVDREERPDVDEIYMAAVQAVSGRGGWPMSVFMTPAGEPFFGGTYFPPDDRYGGMGFKSLLGQVAKVWKERREDVLKNAEQLSAAVRQELAGRDIPAQGTLDAALLDDAVEDLYTRFDAKRGGFGSAPKFPPNNGLPFLIYLQGRPMKAAEKIRNIVTLTLDQMALGGIHDQLAGGFHRYSTDECWLVPHFEKMLYDNAMLARSYAEASVAYKNPEYERVARDTYDWVLREMAAPEGGFYSALDADSEGHEGKFYVWEQSEIETLLGKDAPQFCRIFNVRKDGNFKEEASGQPTSVNILHLTEPLAEQSAALKLDEAELRKKVIAWKTTLLAARVKRVWPGLDDKILTAWNGLMISSLARGSVLLKEPRYRAAAIKAAEFELNNLRTADGRWLATHRKGQSRLPAYLDDHAFVAVAFLDLFEATGEERWKQEAISTVALLDKHFADSKGGGYFFTADDHEKLLARTKDPIDKAIPSGNGWAAQALVRLSKLTGNASYHEKAQALLAGFQGLMERAPQATESLLLALALDLDARPKAAGSSPIEAFRAEPKETKSAVTAELLIGSSALPRGASVPLAVRLTVKKGFHIQAHAPAEGFIGTRFTLASGSPGTLRAEKYPEPKIMKAPELGGELKIYSGEVLCGAQLDVPANAPLGAQALKVKVRFQACDDKSCQAPEDVILSLPVEVVAPDAPVSVQNEEIFKKLKLDK